MIPDEAYMELEEALGPGNVSREPAVMDSYTWQAFAELLGQTSGWCPHRPAAVVLPGSTEEVQAVVRICNRHGFQFKPMCTGWGAWNALGTDEVVQVDLRRMDRILEIDEKNMYAVVEPYAICAQLQAEAMKRGLNCHIIGAGSGSSPLASATSLCGYGWSGLTTGYSPRNLLAVEWVRPDNGDVLWIGSLGQGVGWFNGDGPGPSLRGAVRGYMGNCGGLGIFTRCALKLFHWPGPPEPEVKGSLLDAVVDVPENTGVYICVFPSFEKYADAVYRIGDAEIGYMHCKNAIGSFMAAMAPRLFRKIRELPSLRAALEAQEHMFQFVIFGSSPGEFAYQEKVLKRIVADNSGIILDMNAIPPMRGQLWWGFMRAALPPLIFRLGGSFGTSFGALEGWDHPVLQAREAAKLKKEFIDEGKIIDDLADNAWGGIYEGSTCFGHQEQLYMYDPRSPEQMEGAGEYLARTILETGRKNLGPGLGFAGGAITAELFGPMMCNYQDWLREIKNAFDPDWSSDASFCISRDPAKLLEGEARRRGAIGEVLMQGLEELLGGPEPGEEGGRSSG